MNSTIKGAVSNHSAYFIAKQNGGTFYDSKI